MLRLMHSHVYRANGLLDSFLRWPRYQPRFRPPSGTFRRRSSNGTERSHRAIFRSNLQRGVQLLHRILIATSTSPFPLTEEHMLRFVVSLRRRLSYKSIKLRLAGIQLKSLTTAFREQINSFSRVYYALRGIAEVAAITRQQLYPSTVEPNYT